VAKGDRSFGNERAKEVCVMQTADTVLNVLRRKSEEDARYIFQRLYRNLYNVDMFKVAYANIYSHEGNMTAGVDGKTIDGFSLDLVEHLIERLKQEKYYPTPVRRTYIPKKNGKKRPLGIPSFRDKLVQEVVRMILDAVYDPIFSDSSHGYRPNRSCQTALYQIKTTGRGTSWVIEGDIEGFFDNIDHETMLSLLRKKIDDGRFIELVRRFLQAGHMEFKEVYRTLSGTLQGGIISPILANIYLHELDSFMSTVELKYRKGETRARNNEYRRLTYKRHTQYHKGNVEEARRILKEMKKLPTQDMMDPHYTRAKYVRYADDFVVMVIGGKKLAEEIREETRKFLQEKLHLNLSMEKTKITNLGDENVRFLGYDIARSLENSQVKKNTLGIKRRTVNGTIQLLVPPQVIKEHLKPFVKNGKSVHNNARINDSILDIINTYNSEIRGLYNYYSMATDVSKKMGKFKFYHYYSMVKTIARKEKTSVKKVISKYGVAVPRKDGTGTRNIVGVQYETKEGTHVMTYFNESLARTEQPRTDSADRLVIDIPVRCQLLTRLENSRCELCGKEGGQVQVHHVRKLKDVKKKYAKRGKAIPEWVLRMASVRRKTLVVCKPCHMAIHAGSKTI
jgi:group II intron reverse transcriptase/maturase